MSRAEKFIEENTRNCSNEIIIPTQDGCSYTKGYEPWLTPDHARKVAEIAREETIKFILHKLSVFLDNKDDRDSYTIGYVKRHLKDLKIYLTKENKRRENDYWWYLGNQLRKSNVIASVTKDNEKGFIVELKLMNPTDGRTSPSISLVFENIEELNALANGIVALAEEIKEQE